MAMDTWCTAAASFVLDVAASFYGGMTSSAGMPPLPGLLCLRLPADAALATNGRLVRSHDRQQFVQVLDLDIRGMIQAFAPLPETVHPGDAESETRRPCRIPGVG